MVEPIIFVIVNWNLKQDTADCIESLISANARLDEIIVVDNGSSDGSYSFLKEKFGPSLHVLRLKENKGFASGSNAGIACAMDRGAKWIFLMNNDTVVAADFIQQLDEAVTKGESQYLLYGPLILYHSNPDLIWFLADRLVPGTMIGRNPYAKKNINTLNLPDLLPADFVNGCGMLLHRDVIKTIGMFDTSFFMYQEEVDFCWRARRAGFQMAGAPKARMWHKISTASSKQKGKTRYWQVRNQIWVYRRYSGIFMRVFMFFFMVLRIFRLFLTDIRTGQLILLPHMFRGFWDGWTTGTHLGVKS